MSKFFGNVVGSSPTNWGKIFRSGIWNVREQYRLSKDGNWVKLKPPSIEYLVVAGGGGGGGPHPAGGGGGGAGGFISGFLSDSSTQYQVRVGSGGNSNSTGTPSYFGSIISNGGGSGDGTQNGSPGGSGGGGGGTRGYGGSTSGGFGFNPSTPAPVLSSVPLPSPYSITQGNNGGDGNQNYHAGGGGGAGSVGGSSGGIGTTSSITGVTTYYAGGGGGHGYSGTNPGGLGGGGRGGTSAPAPVTPSTDGNVNTGGGGGGMRNGTSNGGSGIVIIKFAKNYREIQSIPVGITYTLDTTTDQNSYIYKFTAGIGTVYFT